MSNPHAISESDANKQFGPGIVRLVLPVAVIDNVKYYSPSQVARKRDERPAASNRIERNWTERMALRF